MSPNVFSLQSLSSLQGVDIRLQDLAFKVLQIHDCKVTEGLRTEAQQRIYVAKGASKTMNSRHLTGHAIDMYPYPIDWNNFKRFYYFAGLVMATAYWMDVPIRWGGDWDGDNDLDDQNFNDLGHFEIPRGSE